MPTTPLPLLAVLVVVGVLMGRFLPESTGVLALGVTLAVLGALVCMRGRVAMRAVFWLAAALLFGAFRGQSLARPAVRDPGTAETHVLTLRIERGCFHDEQGSRCIAHDGHARVQLTTRGAQCHARAGDLVRVTAVQRTLVPERNGVRDSPGDMLALAGVRSTAFTTRCTVISSHPSLLDHLRRVATSARHALDRGLSRALSPEHLATARALLFGDLHSFTQNTREAFRNAGLSHLLAVSGAHIALMGLVFTAAVDWLVRRVALRTPWRVRTAIVTAISSPALLAVVFACGESPSAYRAWITALFTRAALLTGRTPHAEAVVAATALVMVVPSPELAFHPGWQLSVLAAWALVRGNAPAPRTRFAFVITPLRAALRVSVVTAPVLAWHFQQVPLSALVVNVAIAPVAELLCLPAVLAAGVLGLALPTTWSHALATPAEFPLWLLIRAPSIALELPAAFTRVPPPTGTQAIALTLGLLLLVGLRVRARASVFALTLLVCAVAELVHLPHAQPRGVLRVTALDVGQGDALVIDLPDGACMLLDAGGSHDERIDPGATTVLPFLLARRRTHLAAVVASHPHPDHIGGLPTVMRAVSVDAVWDTTQGAQLTPVPRAWQAMHTIATERGIPVLTPATLCGPARPFHGAMLRVIAPCEPITRSTQPNNASFVIELTYGRARVLLPGDLEAAGEARVLSSLQPVTLLKLGHHGSRTSTRDAWLDRLAPRVAIVSAGHPSPFGHPHEEVLARLARRGVAVYGTPTHGAVSVTLREDGSFTLSTGVAIDRDP